MGMDFRRKLKAFFSPSEKIDDALFDDLTDILIEGDFQAVLAVKTVERLRECVKREKCANNGDVKRLLERILKEILTIETKMPVVSSPPVIPAPSGALTLILLLGVNGVGKTTSAAKLGNLFKKHGENLAGLGKPILAAADTFRAAAIDQLKIHGERLGLRVVAHQHGSDPAAVIYDALEAALSSNAPLVIADTAGRMHTKTSLVEELKKIDRVAGKTGRPIQTVRYLVLDATTGSNAIAQAEAFNAAVKLDGIILTKYDSTAKGGVIFALAETLALPVIYLCTGEQYEDIRPFDPLIFVQEFCDADAGGGLKTEGDLGG
jgi:fused signal recognition particle receptor